MRKSDLLRVQDVRDAYRLIGDCRDLGSEPALWQRRMLEGLCQLVGAAKGTGGEGFWVRPAHPIQPLSVVDVGFDARGHELACLIEGDSEKQAATRLGLSPTTMHQYVTMLYRRFGVRSRGQLLAHVLKRNYRPKKEASD